jgi:hypothetical protein
VRNVSAETRIPPVSIWHGAADRRVVLRNWHELLEQWTAVHGVPAKPARSERNGPLMRNLSTPMAPAPRGPCPRISHPNRGARFCGQIGDFVVAAQVCAATEIAQFWGLPLEN